MSSTALVPIPINTGDYAQLERSTTDEALVELWATWPRKAASPGTTAWYRRTGRTFLAAVGKPLQAITAVDLKAWAEGLSGAVTTKRSTISCVRSLFAFALRMGYVRANPAAVIAPPPARDSKHARMLSEPEAVALILCAAPGRDRSFVRTLYSSGARISELVGLTWADVQPVASGAVLHIWGKGGKQRQVGISADTYAGLVALRGDAADSERVFAFDRTTGHRIVKRAARAAGLPKPVSAHWFRHAHASHALARGASAVDVQEQLGHASLATTTQYAHAAKPSSSYLAV